MTVNNTKKLLINYNCILISIAPESAPAAATYSEEDGYNYKVPSSSF